MFTEIRCRNLFNDTSRQVATLLRMVEVFTSFKFWGRDVEKIQERLDEVMGFWKHLVCEGQLLVSHLLLYSSVT